MIHDIFSKKPKKQKEDSKIKIIADIHEKESQIIPSLIELGANVEIKSLEIGDYLINNMAIERKSASDLISSMISKRLQEQLNQIQKYEKKLFIIEGDLDKTEFNIHPNAIKGQIIAILTHYNIPIIFTKNTTDTASYIFILAKQQLNGVVESSLHARKPKTLQEQKQYIIESFPGLGPKNAALLLKKFKSVKNIVNAKEEELEKEIGKKARVIKDLVE